MALIQNAKWFSIIEFMMKNRLRIIVGSILILVLIGCANKPTVHVYSKYLSEDQIDQLQHRFVLEDYNVELHDLDFPTSITENTLLYSLLLDDPKIIDKVRDIAENQGLRLNHVQALKERNHWYTKNSLAVYFFPDETSQNKGFFKKDLIRNYRTTDCSVYISLQLNADGTYLYKGNEKTVIDDSDLIGKWLYRQYPYLELRPFGAEHSDQYFELSQQTKQDQISQITFIKLKPIQSHVAPQTCSLTYGVRE